MPPEVLALAKGRVRPLRRDPHYVLPTIGGPGAPYLWFGRDRAASRAQLERTFSAADATADDALQQELGQLREDPLRPGSRSRSPSRTPPSVVRPRLRETFVDLVRGTVVDYLARFGFSSELLVTMYVVTDGLSGLTAGPDTGHRPQFPGPQHVPAARRRRYLDGGRRRNGSRVRCLRRGRRQGRRPAGHRRRGHRARRFRWCRFVSSSPTAARSRQRPSWRPAIRGAPRESPVQTRRLSW